MTRRPAYYALAGGPVADLITLLHPPYTAWHLAYVAIGAGVSGSVEPARLAGVLAAFFFGTGVGAHALDEWKGRPLGTGLSERSLLSIGLSGLTAALAVAVAGAFVISPLVLVWALAGMLLSLGYVLEWRRWLHSDLGFALAWGAFPVLAGAWAQTEALSAPALLAAAGAVLISLAQRSLSTPARLLRRRGDEVRVVMRIDGREVEWDLGRLLLTWERPLRFAGAGVVVLSIALVLAAR